MAAMPRRAVFTKTGLPRMRLNGMYGFGATSPLPRNAPSAKPQVDGL